MPRQTASGSIPACAGEPPEQVGQHPVIEVYPRVCGGTPGHFDAADNRQGLSPRVRGNPHQVQHHAISSRSIPACAGEPHSDSYADAGDKGLSPRVRGNLAALPLARYQMRSIPACAGEPPGAGTPGSRGEVYPRVCGGTVTDRQDRYGTSGLSPRVRGNRRRRAGAPAQCGSIPACAGEPAAPQTAGCCPGVYPRVCGGTQSHRRIATALRGLSPRVRGNPLKSRLRTAIAGSIPACAGEPE